MRKNLVFVLAIMSMLGCGDDAPTDPLADTWFYEIQTGDLLFPVTFQIAEADTTYVFKEVKFEFRSIDLDGCSISGVTKGSQIKRIGMSESGAHNMEYVFYNCKLVSGGMSADSIYFRHDFEKTTRYNQMILRK
jgi:hypothetical protein